MAAPRAEPRVPSAYYTRASPTAMKFHGSVAIQSRYMTMRHHGSGPHLHAQGRHSPLISPTDLSLISSPRGAV